MTFIISANSAVLIPQGELKAEASSTIKISDKDSKKAAKKAAKKAYKKLNTAADKCDEIAATVDGAWYFYVYLSDDYDMSDYEEVVEDFSKNTGIPKSFILQELEANGLDEESAFLYYMFFQDLDCCLGVVEKYYEDKGAFTATENNINKAKNFIKKAGKKSSYYKTLKKYFVTVQNYFNFVKSPTGSYSELEANINGYKKSIEEYKATLSFDLE